MKIGELARQAGVSVQTVRFYERRRLMPTPRRTPAGYRLYDESHLEIVRAIKQMQHFGFSLQEARRVLQLFAVPGDGGEDSPYAHGSDECLREAAKIGEQKLEAMNRQIAGLIQVRDELQQILRQIHQRLAPPQKQRTSKTPRNGLQLRRSGRRSISTPS